MVQREPNAVASMGQQFSSRAFDTSTSKTEGHSWPFVAAGVLARRSRRVAGGLQSPSSRRVPRVRRHAADAGDTTSADATRAEARV